MGHKNCQNILKWLDTQFFESVFPQVSPIFIAFFSAKSCSHLKKLNPGTESGTYIIDPDGYGALLPFNVTCNMTDKNGVGVTVISHDNENRALVDGCDSAGCHSRDIHYTGASLCQLASLTDVSSHCVQFIKYECFHSRLNFWAASRFGWWVSRNSKVMTCWGGASPDSKECACGRRESCVGGKRCNCDQNDEEWREDSGLLTDKSTLPVTELKFGDVGFTGRIDEKGYHTLGKFKCYGPGDDEIGSIWTSKAFWTLPLVLLSIFLILFCFFFLWFEFVLLFLSSCLLSRKLKFVTRLGADCCH